MEVSHESRRGEKEGSKNRSLWALALSQSNFLRISSEDNSKNCPRKPLLTEGIPIFSIYEAAPFYRRVHRELHRPRQLHWKSLFGI